MHRIMSLSSWTRRTRVIAAAGLVLGLTGGLSAALAGGPTALAATHASSHSASASPNVTQPGTIPDTQEYVMAQDQWNGANPSASEFVFTGNGGQPMSTFDVTGSTFYGSANSDGSLKEDNQGTVLSGWENAVNTSTTPSTPEGASEAWLIDEVGGGLATTSRTGTLTFTSSDFVERVTDPTDSSLTCDITITDPSSVTLSNTSSLNRYEYTTSEAQDITTVSVGGDCSDAGIMALTNELEGGSFTATLWVVPTNNH